MISRKCKRMLCNNRPLVVTLMQQDSRHKQEESILFSLSHELLEAVASLLDLQDLCCFRRAAKCCMHVTGSEAVWQHLYQETYGAVPDRQQRSWSQTFRLRYIAERQRRARKQLLRTMNLQSSLQAYRSHVQEARQHLHQASARLKSLQQETEHIEAARRAGTASQCWQPAAIKHHHDKIMAQTPLQADSRAEQLKQELQDCRLEIAMWKRRLSSRQEASRTAQHSLRQRW